MSHKIEPGLPEADDNLTPPIDKSNMSDERKRLFERVEQINRAWLESMRDMRRAEAEFSVRLFACHSASDALVLCHQWMAKRLEILASEQQLFARAWGELVTLLDKGQAVTATRKTGR